jgi:hypothetical protein
VLLLESEDELPPPQAESAKSADRTSATRPHVVVLNTVRIAMIAS